MPAQGPPVLSWSTVTTPGLVLGRLPRDPSLDRAAADRAGVRVVRRSSGGGPVLWDAGLLSLDVVLPAGHRLAPRDVVAAYRWLGEAIADALRTLGVDDVEVVAVERAREARRRPGPARDACFGGLSPYEVLAGGRKVAGLSQARRRQGALLQAGVPLRLDPALLGRLLGRDDAFADGLSATAAGLGELAPGLDGAVVVGAVEAALRASQGVTLRDDVPSAAEREAIAAVTAEALADGAGR
jgi:lipoate-protein ligase A